MESKPILEQSFWDERLRRAIALGQLHKAVFECGLGMWEAIEAKHREILARHVGPSTSVLDCGCGWGRLVSLMPAGWEGRYLGIDLNPTFVTLARIAHPGRDFFVQDLRVPPKYLGGDSVKTFDLAVLVSIRPMVVRELGGGAWERMEGNVRRVVDKLLYLEYDPEDEGSLE